MPLCTLYLLALQPSSHAVPQFLTDLHASLSAAHQPVITARPVRWIITPSNIDSTTLLDPLAGPTSSDHTYTTFKSPGASTTATSWDLLLIFPSAVTLPSKLLDRSVRAHFTLTAGIPSSLLSGFSQKNEELLHPVSSLPPLTGTLDRPLIASEGQNLELTQELRDWCLSYWRHQGQEGKGAVSMLNFLAFAHPKEKAHDSYGVYGKAFAESIGKRRGGVAKIVGKVVPSKHGPIPARPEQENERLNGEWEEIALAHYPSLEHFCDMAGSPDYQEVNRRYRMPALRDTCILMCSELNEGVVSGARRQMRGTPEHEKGERADGIVGRSAKM